MPNIEKLLKSLSMMSNITIDIKMISSWCFIFLLDLLYHFSRSPFMGGYLSIYTIFFPFFGKFNFEIRFTLELQSYQTNKFIRKYFLCDIIYVTREIERR